MPPQAEVQTGNQYTLVLLYSQFVWSIISPKLFQQTVRTSHSLTDHSHRVAGAGSMYT
jgi:hypothetical protein